MLYFVQGFQFMHVIVEGQKMKYEYFCKAFHVKIIYL